MAKGKLVQSKANVQRLLNDKDAMRKLVADRYYPFEFRSTGLDVKSY